jgi:hypothetical protein
MDNEQCREIYQQLIRILERENLDWVIDLATEDIDSGKVLKQKQNSQENVQMSLLEQQENLTTSVSERGTNVVIREYTEKEKLRILIDIIKQTIVDTTLMESRVISFFQNSEYFMDMSAEIRFASNRQETFSLSLDNIFKREKKAYELLDFLQELKKEVER